jgi:hypothetical protein
MIEYYINLKGMRHLWQKKLYFRVDDMILLVIG